MKSISKAMIAVMIAAVMCAVPLFIIEDTDAADFEPVAKGASFKASSIDDDKFNGFVSEQFKKQLCLDALSAMDINDDDVNWEISGISIKNVKNIKMSRANETTSTCLTKADALAITYDIEFQAKRLLTSTRLFSTTDGTQALYKAMGDSNIIAANEVIKVNGTVTQDVTTITETNYEKVNSGKYVVTSEVKKTYTGSSFDGYFEFKEKKVTLENSSDLSYEVETTAEYDDKIAEVTSASKVFKTTTLGKAGGTAKIKYSVGDVSGSIERDMDKNGLEYIIGMMIYPDTLGYVRGVASDYGYVFDIADAAATMVSYALYDSLDSTKALFVDYMLATAYQNNDKCVGFLNENGTTGTEYSDAKSVADSAYETVSVGGSGNNNIIFYVIIGVLAVAVVALAVLMIKKK